MLLVSGTTCTRLRAWFAASLLTMIAGLVLRISPPTAGSNATHQTSPRRGALPGLIGHIAGQVFYPFLRFALVFLVGRHGLVPGEKVAGGHVRPRQIVQKAADPPRPDHPMQTLVNLVLNRN